MSQRTEDQDLLPFEPEIILIPTGPFVMGSTEVQVEDLIRRFPDVDRRLFERELPQHTVHLPAYRIGKTPVTNAQFAAFVEAIGYVTLAEQEGWGFHTTHKLVRIEGAYWRHPHGVGSDIQEKSNHPVVQISWIDALAYCAWLSKVTAKPYRLLTEAEWEKAARGTDGRIRPWGDSWDPMRCNCEKRVRDTTPAGKYSPQGDSPYGCVDMLGNVGEWTSTTSGVEGPWNPRFTYPYRPDDGREDLDPSLGRRGNRGGSWSRGEGYVRCAFRLLDPPTERYSTMGFRVALSVDS